MKRTAPAFKIEYPSGYVRFLGSITCSVYGEWGSGEKVWCVDGRPEQYSLHRDAGKCYFLLEAVI